jgi:hypothetical protein
MHFEFLIEDQSGKRFLEIFLPNLVGPEHSFNIHAYKGIGRIPKGLATRADAGKRILLEQLPRLLRGYGNAFANDPSDYFASVIVICDLDDKVLATFMDELSGILNECSPRPKTHFCLAIEEGEAWLLGDIAAVKMVYPRAKDTVLNSYVNDSICGTWERLADAVYPGGAQALAARGWQAVGKEKFTWSEKITPHMTIDANRSPSFACFRDTIRSLLKPAETAV